MSYSFRWYDEAQTILVCDVRDHWTWDDALRLVDEQGEWMAQVNHGVHTIFWLHGIPDFPQGKSTLNHVYSLITRQHPNERMSVFIGLNRYGQTLANIAAKVYGLHSLVARYRFVSSIEEALDEIARYEKVEA